MAHRQVEAWTSVVRPSIVAAFDPGVMRERGLSAADRRRLVVAGVLVAAGLAAFAAAVTFANVAAGNSAAFVRAGYCSVPGNTENGAPLPQGTFLDLTVGAPSVDGHYFGAVPANFVAGVGLTCGPPPPGYVPDGLVDVSGNPGGMYPYYVKANGS